MSNKSAAKLAEAIRGYLRQIQDESQEMMGGDPTWGQGGPLDPVGDSGVWVGSEIQQYTKSDADVVLHYDGSGYDLFSPSGELAYGGDWAYRERIEAIAKDHGYHSEDLNGWSLGFYPA